MAFFKIHTLSVYTMKHLTETKHKDNNNTDNNETGKHPVTKEKLQSIMEAASALTTLHDKELDRSHSNTPEPKKVHVLN